MVSSCFTNRWLTRCVTRTLHVQPSENDILHGTCTTVVCFVSFRLLQSPADGSLFGAHAVPLRRWMNASKLRSRTFKSAPVDHYSLLSHSENWRSIMQSVEVCAIHLASQTAILHSVWINETCVQHLFKLKRIDNATCRRRIQWEFFHHQLPPQGLELSSAVYHAHADVALCRMLQRLRDRTQDMATFDACCLQKEKLLPHHSKLVMDSARKRCCRCLFLSTRRNLIAGKKIPTVN